LQCSISLISVLCSTREDTIADTSWIGEGSESSLCCCITSGGQWALINCPKMRSSLMWLTRGQEKHFCSAVKLRGPRNQCSLLALNFWVLTQSGLRCCKVHSLLMPSVAALSHQHREGLSRVWTRPSLLCNEPTTSYAFICIMDIRKYFLPFLHAAAFMYTKTAFMCSLAFSSSAAIIPSSHSSLLVLFPGLLITLSVSRTLSSHFCICWGAVPSPSKGSGWAGAAWRPLQRGPEEQRGLCHRTVRVSAVFAQQCCEATETSFIWAAWTAVSSHSCEAVSSCIVETSLNFPHWTDFILFFPRAFLQVPKKKKSQTRGVQIYLPVFSAMPKQSQLCYGARYRALRSSLSSMRCCWLLSASSLFSFTAFCISFGPRLPKLLMTVSSQIILICLPFIWANLTVA